MDVGNYCEPEDDWGCVNNDDLFFSAGPTPSLRSLVEKFDKSRHTDEMLKHVATEFSNLDTGIATNISNSIDKEEEIVVRDVFEEGTVDTTQPIGILKKKAQEKKAHTLKRVTFEIERFVAANIGDQAERLNAEQQLLMQLGAKPARKQAVNYKQLKNERLEAKRKKVEGADSASSLDKLLRGIQGGGKVKKFKARQSSRRWNRKK